MATGSNLYKEINVSSAILLNIAGNPYELLPALTGNEYYSNMRIVMEYTFISAAYVCTDPLALYYNPSGYIVAVAEVNFLASTTNRVVEFYNIGNNHTDVLGLGGAYADALFAPSEGLYLDTYGQSSSPSVGSGTVKIKIFYDIRKFG